MTETLEPIFTAFDKRVLTALDKREFRNAWNVAERVGEYDAGAVRDTLRGLSYLGYAWSRRFDKRQEWRATGKTP